MNNYFSTQPDNYYPIDGCWLLVRDAWQLLYKLYDLPKFSNQFITTKKASTIISSYKNYQVKQINKPEHGCMITAVNGKRWHCGIYSTEQMPHHVIHCVSGKVKIETFHQFKTRFDSVEFYKCLT